jgi:hypothetical protein
MLQISGKGIIEKACISVIVESFRNVLVHDGVSGVGRGAFQNLTSLEAVRLPESVSFVDREAFAGCSNLKIFERASAVGAGVAGAVDNPVGPPPSAYPPAMPISIGRYSYCDTRYQICWLRPSRARTSYGCTTTVCVDGSDGYVDISNCGTVTVNDVTVVMRKILLTPYTILIVLKQTNVNSAAKYCGIAPKTPKKRLPKTPKKLPKKSPAQNAKKSVKKSPAQNAKKSVKKTRAQTAKKTACPKAKENCQAVGFNTEKPVAPAWN